MKMKTVINKRRKTLCIAGLLVTAVLLISSCSAGVSKEQRLDLFIADMESGTVDNPPDPREHFRGHPSAEKIDSGTFPSTDMDPTDGLNITGYDIDGDTFTMTFTTNAVPDGNVETASFHSEPNDTGGEDWYIKSMTVPIGGGDGDVKVIPDNL